MLIDIVSYTPTQLASLSLSAIREIRSAQLKKNKMLRQLLKDVKKERNSLVKRGIFDSCIWEKIQAELEEECNARIEELRQALLFYLEYNISKTEEDLQLPYEVDYSLSFDERYLQIKNYYLSTYTDAEERFIAFNKDEFAPLYLGELYSTLYDEFAVLANG